MLKVYLIATNSLVRPVTSPTINKGIIMFGGRNPDPATQRSKLQNSYYILDTRDIPNNPSKY